MNYKEVFKTIEKTYTPLSTECQQELIASSKVCVYKKGDIVVREGQFSKKVFFIVQGCSRAYYLKGGKDISDWFTFENQFMASIVSFFSNEPSPHYVEFI